MRCGFQELVSNLCYYKKPTAPLVSASAAVIAKPQPQRGSDRQYPLYFYGFSLLLNSSLFFLYLVSTFFKSMMAVVFPPLIPFIPVILAFSPFSIFALIVSFSLYLLVSARLTPSPPYVSLPGQHCQQLEHITANCATCGSLKDRKKWMGQHYAKRAGLGVYLLCICKKQFIAICTKHNV